MIAKIIGISFSLFLVYYTDLFYDKQIKKRINEALKEKGIGPNNRNYLIDFLTSYIGFLLYVTSAITALVTLMLSYESDYANIENIFGWQIKSIEMSEISLLLRSLASVILVLVIIRSFLASPNRQPIKLQKGSIIFSSIVILLEIIEII